jgi:hypothetical protein
MRGRIAPVDRRLLPVCCPAGADAALAGGAGSVAAAHMQRDPLGTVPALCLPLTERGPLFRGGLVASTMAWTPQAVNVPVRKAVENAGDNLSVLLTTAWPSVDNLATAGDRTWKPRIHHAGDQPVRSGQLVDKEKNSATIAQRRIPTGSAARADGQAGEWRRRGVKGGSPASPERAVGGRRRRAVGGGGGRAVGGGRRGLAGPGDLDRGVELRESDRGGERPGRWSVGKTDAGAWDTQGHDAEISPASRTSRGRFGKAAGQSRT